MQTNASLSGQRAEMSGKLSIDGRYFEHCDHNVFYKPLGNRAICTK